METMESGVAIRPINTGTAYGIFNTNVNGTNNTTQASFGEKRKYKTNINKNTANATTAHSKEKAYKCTKETAAAKITVKFKGKKEHSNANINTIAILFNALIYPIA